MKNNFDKVVGAVLIIIVFIMILINKDNDKSLEKAIENGAMDYPKSVKR